MNILTVTENKIRFWKNVKDLPKFKTNIELNTGLTMGFYISQDNSFALDFDYHSFAVEEGDIVFYEQVVELEEFSDDMGWPSLTDEQINLYYSTEDIALIQIAKANYTSSEYSLYERAYVRNLEGVDIPEDFPKLDRPIVTDYAEVNVLKEIKRVSVVKYEV